MLACFGLKTVRFLKAAKHSEQSVNPLKMMTNVEKMRIARAHSIGPTVVEWLEQAGYEMLEDFASETPENISFRVEIATGRARNQNAMTAYKNLIELAKSSQLQDRSN